MSVVVTGWKFEIHDVVCLAACQEMASPKQGYIQSRQVWEDPNGPAEWYSVRFVSRDGSFDSETLKLHASEITHRPGRGDGFGFACGVNESANKPGDTK